MGRKDKKRYRDPIISELEEREKIKQSILKVFRARLSSPGGGGAILIGKEPTKSNESNNNTVQEVLYESSSSMSDSEGSTSSTRKTQKRRRRKKRQKSHGKIKKIGTDRHDVAKHLKIANDVRQTVRPTGDTTTVSLISQNRLTRKMGLFNGGKKSSTISRDIYVPESVKRKTQEDLKKILQHSDDEDHTHHIEPLDISKSPLILPKPSNGPALANSNKRSDLGYRSAGSKSITPSSPKTNIVSSTSCVSAASSEDVQDILPEEPNMEGISEILIKNLNLRQFFPGRNLFEETVEELRKIMKQNSFATTPMSKKLKGKDIDSVKRSLLDRYSPTYDQENQQPQHGPCTNKSVYTIKTVPSPHQTKLPRRDYGDKKCLLKYSNDLVTSRSTHLTGVSLSPKHRYGKDFLDGKTLLEANSARSFSPSSAKFDSTVSSLSPSRYDKNALLDGKTLLKCNDDVLIAETCHQMEQLSSKPQPMETDFQKDDALKLLEKNDKKRFKLTANYHGDGIQEIQQDILSILPNDLDITHHSSQSSGYHGSQHSRYGYEEHALRKIDSNAIRGADNMTKFPQSEVGYRTCKENNYESMDILDYLDGPLSETRTKMQKNSRQLVSTTPDSDGLPMWLPPNVHVLILPRKPTFESPSPEKLRPRFMH